MSYTFTPATEATLSSPQARVSLVMSEVPAGAYVYARPVGVSTLSPDSLASLSPQGDPGADIIFGSGLDGFAEGYSLRSRGFGSEEGAVSLFLKRTAGWWN